MVAAADLPRRVVAESLGTALLLATVIGSGIMGEKLCGGNVAIALLANTIATGAGLFAFILLFGPLSGAHFNPAVTLAGAMRGAFPWREVLPYVAGQMMGAFIGVGVAHAMFGEHLVSISTRERAGFSQLTSEFVATFGLVSVVAGCTRQALPVVALAVGAYIAAAYWFTASTAFANPAVTLARSVSNTFAGIRPLDVPGFVVAQLIGAVVATWTFRWLLASGPKLARESVAEESGPQ